MTQHPHDNIHDRLRGLWHGLRRLLRTVSGWIAELLRRALDVVRLLIDRHTARMNADAQYRLLIRRALGDVATTLIPAMQILQQAPGERSTRDLGPAYETYSSPSATPAPSRLWDVFDED